MAKHPPTRVESEVKPPVDKSVDNSDNSHGFNKVDGGEISPEELAKMRAESRRREIAHMRFELAKSAIAGVSLHRPDKVSYIAENAVALADAVIDKLGLNEPETYN